ncbi:MAG TPA: hypothetical protein VNK47_10170 [Candidatus Dormibacteraeota bacterium]|nr:hypothetical protein [Candidatus Dormibacteraeota bacterium]
MLFGAERFFVVTIEKKKEGKEEKDGRKKPEKKRTVLKIRHYNGRIPEELIRGIV